MVAAAYPRPIVIVILSGNEPREEAETSTPVPMLNGRFYGQSSINGRAQNRQDIWTRRGEDGRPFFIFHFPFNSSRIVPGERRLTENQHETRAPRA